MKLWRRFWPHHRSLLYRLFGTIDLYKDFILFHVDVDIQAAHNYKTDDGDDKDNHFNLSFLTVQQFQTSSNSFSMFLDFHKVERFL